MLRVLSLLCCSLVVAGSPAHKLGRPDPRDLAAPLRAGVPDVSLRLSPARADFWGGQYTTSTNEHVTVYSSDSYTVDEAVNQRWANFVASLVHGSELPLLTVYLVPPAQVSAICGGPDTYGCYGADRLVAPGEDTANATTEAVLAHEYGHHVAAHRSNDPWRALAWGTKRWASYRQVCRQTRAHQMFPGAESSLLYLFNPGEGFAETYRVLNENKLGLPHGQWLVDSVFLPDARSLALAEQDVLDPWSAPARAAVLRGRFSARGPSVRSFKVATPLDGALSASVESRARLRLELLAGKKRLARGTATATSLVCGSRTLTVRVTRTAGSGPFTLMVSRP